MVIGAVLGTLAILAVILVFLVRDVPSRATESRRALRRERDAYRALVARLQSAAIRSAPVEPFAAIVLDEINDLHNQLSKELTK